MVKNMQIKRVEHPYPDLLPKGKAKTYLALTWENEHGSTALHMKYVEDTLKKYYLGKEMTNLEYVEALHMVQKHKKTL